MDSIPNVHQIKAQILARQYAVTANSRIADRTKPSDAAGFVPQGVSWGDAPLLNDKWDRDEVEKYFLKFLRRSAFKGKWKTWAKKSFTEDAVYITNDGQPALIGMDAIVNYIVPSTACIPCADYRRIDFYEITQNRVTYYLWNDLTNPNTNVRYGNGSVSIIYYAGDGRFKFEEDLYNFPYLQASASAYFSSGIPAGCYPVAPCPYAPTLTQDILTLANQKTEEAIDQTIKQ